MRNGGESKRRKDWQKLTYEQMSAIMTSRTDCIYCHMPFTEKNPPTRDRKNPLRGYEYGNVVLSCHDCNMIKNSVITFEEMLIVGPIVADLKKKRAA